MTISKSIEKVFLLHKFVKKKNFFYLCGIILYMIVEFGETYLRDLYVTGACSDKKHRYQPDVIKRYKRGVDYLRHASRKEDLFRINSLNFKALTGNKAGLYSIRVNNQYRIEFTLAENQDNPILTICSIKELSNHYE